MPPSASSISWPAAGAQARAKPSPHETEIRNAPAGMRFLEMSPPNLAEVMEALGSVVRDADRAKDIVGRVRDHIKKAPPRIEPFDLNEAMMRCS
jgi:hypothetical protein